MVYKVDKRKGYIVAISCRFVAHSPLLVDFIDDNFTAFSRDLGENFSLFNQAKEISLPHIALWCFGNFRSQWLHLDCTGSY